MTSTLTQQHLRSAKDWAEIQERMLVPLYEAVYDRLQVGARTRLLGLGCGSGLALLLAASRGARVVGTEVDQARLALAKARLSPEPQRGTPAWSVQLLPGGPDHLPAERAYDLVTAFDTRPSPATLAAAAARTEPGSPVVLAGWGTAEECEATRALDFDAPSVTPARSTPHWRPGGRATLEKLATEAGLTTVDAGRVRCPFGYPDVDSAVRGLLSTDFYRSAVDTADEDHVVRALFEALDGRQQPDGTVWLPNLFHFVVARTPAHQPTAGTQRQDDADTHRP